MGASESKLAFKEDIFRLAGEDNIPIDSQWWTQASDPLFTSSNLAQSFLRYTPTTAPSIASNVQHTAQIRLL